jgi:hypothetical protein
MVVLSSGGPAMTAMRRCPSSVRCLITSMLPRSSSPSTLSTPRALERRAYSTIGTCGFITRTASEPSGVQGTWAIPSTLFSISELSSSTSTSGELSLQQTMSR